MSREVESLRSRQEDTVPDLSRLRASVEDWTLKAAKAIWSFRRGTGPSEGSFWKDSRVVAEPALEPPNITSTARSYVGLVAADRVRPIDVGEAEWWSALGKFAVSFRSFECGGTFYEVTSKRGSATGSGISTPPREEQNNFDVAHLVDFLIAEDYTSRFYKKKKGLWSGENIIAASAGCDDDPKVCSESDLNLQFDPNIRDKLAEYLQKSLSKSVSPFTDAAGRPRTDTAAESLSHPPMESHAHTPVDAGAAGSADAAPLKPAPPSSRAAENLDGQILASGDAEMKEGEEANAQFDNMENGSAAVADNSDRSASQQGSQRLFPNRGEVEFEPGNPDSAHFFATLHTLRALHFLNRRLDQARLEEIVAATRAFSLEQCYYHQRGTSKKQDTVRLAFAGCIYILYDRDADKDLALAVIETLSAAQQENGSWPATHPIIRKRDRAPWHISSHEVALCLTWLYFQPALPDEARPLLVKMMRKYFDRAVVNGYHGGRFDLEPRDKAGPDAPPNGAAGWQDDHTRSKDVIVGWANAVVCHFLANYVLVLDDWINRTVVETLGLDLSTEYYLIDETAGAPSRRWRYDLELQRLKRSGVKDSSVSSARVWPDLPPHAWRPAIEDPQLGQTISRHWTDPSDKAKLTDKLGSKILKPITDDPREQPLPNLCSGLLPGDPGTRKTSLVKQIGESIEWPMVAVPASLIFARGFENMEAEANSVFWNLKQLRRCVIFFDEFEEFFLDRKVPQEGIRYESRTIAAYTTSAMLPRLQELHDERRCLIFFATNHEEKLDPAIIRRGRMDFKARVDHPTLKRLSEYVAAMPDPAQKRQKLTLLSGTRRAALLSAAAAKLELIRQKELEAAKVEGKECEPKGKFGAIEAALRDVAELYVDDGNGTADDEGADGDTIISWANDAVTSIEDRHEDSKDSGPAELISL